MLREESAWIGGRGSSRVAGQSGHSLPLLLLYPSWSSPLNPPTGPPVPASTTCRLLVLLLLVGSISPLAAQSGSIGQVKNVSGTALVERGGESLPVTPGFVLLESDLLRTGGDGRIGVTLRDETRLSLGPRTELQLSRFTYAPGEERFALTLRLVQGTLSYISGRIARLSPGSVRLETPTSVVAVRGTHLALRVE